MSRAASVALTLSLVGCAHKVQPVGIERDPSRPEIISEQPSTVSPEVAGEPGEPTPSATVTPQPDPHTQADAQTPKQRTRAVIVTHLGEVRACYERELAKDPKLEGRVEVQLTILADGSVASSRVAAATIDRPPMTACILGAVQSWKFDRNHYGGVTVVNYPFVLKTTQ